ncbi:MAG: FAD binding domain-containing protein [Pseudonocardia sp.]
MRDFGYARAVEIADAVTALEDPRTSVIAGGTELLNWLRLGIADPEQVIDIGSLAELTGVEHDGDRLRIGSRTTLNEVGEHPLVERYAAALALSCRQAASHQIRNRATLGGNVLQRTRCPYFRAEEPLPWPCNKRAPGSGCASRTGRHERQAIFGWTDDCIAVQPSDPTVALSALDAEVELVGPAGQRRIPMREFHLTQAEAAAAGDPTRETRLNPGELIVSYLLPVRPAQVSAYVKVRERASYEYAIVSAAAAVELSGDRITAARVALGSVAQRPWRLDAAEAALVGQPLTREALLPVVDAAMADATPLPHNGFKVAMARNAAMRALLNAGGMS